MRQRVNDRHIATNRILKISLRRGQVKPEGACVAVGTVTHDARTACEVIAKGIEVEGRNDFELGAQEAGFVETRSQGSGHESTLFTAVCPTDLVLSCEGPVEVTGQHGRGPAPVLAVYHNERGPA